MTTDQGILFETEHYRLRGGASLPVVLGDSVIYVSGYTLYNKRTGQADGEFRSLADAALYMMKWSEDLETVQLALAKQQLEDE